MGVSDPSPTPVLDLRGLHCPMPVLRLQKALRGMKAGQVIEVLCTDPLTAIDIPHGVSESGDALVDQSVSGDTLTFLVRKGG